jgi:serine/threonine protein phosphatase PrpC
MIIGNHIFTANLGDSRAIIVNKKSNWAFKELSID